ncbi:MAG TPA: RES domain-containing protein [Aestuariivirgaceae bacterium]|nr:RES domain-containing protein [Aestuariivirgaceae bacterium]
MSPQRLDRVLFCHRIGDPNGQFPIYDAAGSRLFPGRWNTSETPVIYASEYYSTAMLEKLASGSGRIPPNQHYIRITVPNGVSYETVTSDTLPRWSDRDRRVAQRFGSAWASELRSAILIVPSYVARIERNVIINLGHDEARSIAHDLPQPVWWDERLFSTN